MYLQSGAIEITLPVCNDEDDTIDLGGSQHHRLGEKVPSRLFHLT